MKDPATTCIKPEALKPCTVISPENIEIFRASLEEVGNRSSEIMKRC